jgi:hypothetical protein
MGSSDGLSSRSSPVLVSLNILDGSVSLWWSSSWLSSRATVHVAMTSGHSTTSAVSSTEEYLSIRPPTFVWLTLWWILVLGLHWWFASWNHLSEPFGSHSETVEPTSPWGEGLCFLGGGRRIHVLG